MSNFATQLINLDKNYFAVLDTLITSKIRIKLLLKFFRNSKSEPDLRGLKKEVQESGNSIRLELNKFENSGLDRKNRRNHSAYYSLFGFFNKRNKSISREISR